MTVRSEFYWESTNYNGTFTGHEDVVPFDGDWGDNENEHAFNLVGEAGGGGLTFDSAFSSKGPFDIDLPLTGGAVEDRTGGNSKKYSIHQVFNNSLASVASATTTCGSVASFGVDSANLNQAFVNLVGVNCNASEVTVTTNGVVDTQGNNLSSASITFCLLVGDVDGNGVVDRDDYRLVKRNLGRPADMSNFRSDVNASAFINSLDLNSVKAQQGTHCP